MKIITDAVRYPVTTAVGVILLILFGFIALAQIPVQLTPTVDEPTITVTTFWPGASPQEVEREIVDEQEEQLKSLEGLLRMESSSSDSRGSITLTFPVGIDIDSALLKVSNRLEQVEEYPEETRKPVISSVNANENAICWYLLLPKEQDGFEGDITTLYDFVEDYIKPEIERVPGVGLSNFFGGREHELHVIVDPAKLASRQVTFNDLATALERENRNFSGGDFDEGKRRFIVRTIGEYQTPEDIENIVVAVRGGIPIYLRDVGRAELGYRKAGGRVFAWGQPVMAINAIRVPGSNVLEVMEGIKATTARLNEDLLDERGLQMLLAYDVSDYINSAIGLVKQSIAIGGVLATLILLLYLRSRTSTLIIAVAIPISIIGTFSMMYLFGRTLNVVSLAGMAFAVGMVVDNSIVVLENIYRHRQRGKPRFQAARDGAQEVWGAVLASTLTTIVVFIPVVFMQEEAGQLFGDIALALCSAVALSLIISITVIPSLSARILQTAHHSEEKGYNNLWGWTAKAQALTRWVSDTVYRITGSTKKRLAVIATFTLASIGLSYLLMPPTEYLPVGNQNFLFGIMLPPPGYSLDEVSELRKPYEDILRPLWEADPDSAEADEMPGGGVQGYFYVALNDRAFMGVRSRDPLRVKELIPMFYQAGGQLPGAISIVNQASIFQRGFDEGRNIDIDITGPDLERLIEIGGQIFLKVNEVLPGSHGRPIPGLDLDNPEVQVVTHRRRAAELGLSNRELGYAVSALIDGAKATDYQYEGREIDLKIMAEHNDAHSMDLIEQFPIATPDGRLVTLGSVADIVSVNGPV